MSSSSPLSSIAAVTASVIDGRLQTTQHRRHVLRRLHAILVENATKIHDAIRKDSGDTEAEVEVQFYCALQSLRSLLASGAFDPKEELAREYAIARGEDNPARTVGVGLVLLKPIVYQRFLSTLSPLVAAVAAGNCVLLELPSSLRTQETDIILKELLPKALNEHAPILAIVPFGYKVPTTVPVIEVIQEPKDRPSEPPQLLSTLPSLESHFDARVVAIVDRTVTDIASAARSVVTSRLSFQGKAPFAPDQIFVHEFTRKEFLHACVRQAIDKSDGSPQKSGKPNSSNSDARKSKAEHSTKALIEMAKADGDDVLMEGSVFAIVHVQSRKSRLLSMKIREPVLLIHSFSSLDDVLGATSSLTTPLLAAYLFAANSTCKYLGQFLNTRLSVMNQIPVHLLVGPSAPQGHPISLTQRYYPEMFQSPSPQYIGTPPDEGDLAAVLAPSLSASTSSVQKLRSQSQQPLAPLTGQKENHGTMGYFEMAIFMGFGTIVLPALVASSFLVYRGVNLLRS